MASKPTPAKKAPAKKAAAKKAPAARKAAPAKATAPPVDPTAPEALDAGVVRPAAPGATTRAKTFAEAASEVAPVDDVTARGFLGVRPEDV